MKRVAFNGGEISPEMAQRADMDVFHRACSKLVNFDVAQMGGIMRRRGMRPLVALAEGEVALLPYTYTQDAVYLVELHVDLLIVRNREAVEVARFAGGEYSWMYWNPERVNAVQLNSILLLVGPDVPVMQLRLEPSGEWTFERYKFKMPPWYTVDVREHELTAVPLERNAYRVEFSEMEQPSERVMMNGDTLRLSYFTQQQEAFAKSRELREGVRIVQEITEGSTFTKGEKIAVHGDTSCTYWVCKDTRADGWKGARDFVPGLTLPNNYKESFEQAEDLHGFDSLEPIYKLSAEMDFERGDKLAVQSGYWDYYTCIRDFGPDDVVEGKGTPDAYPSHFIRGLAVGAALASKGTWSFYCSGTWFGSYEVRRCYEGTELDLPWETMGESFSRIGSSSNEQINGNEEEEECWMRLFLTRSEFLGQDELDSGFPSDASGNRLIAESYVHDMLLRCEVFGDDVRFVDETPVRLALKGETKTADWSWAAFSVRYGYPSVALLHESRLIFAGTAAQPQTLWFSCTDDLNNFDVGELDSSGLLLTMATSTQAGICWACSRGDIIMLGTEGGEWCIKGADNGELTAKNVRITNYGYNGSAHTPALLTSDSVLYVERGDGRVHRYGYTYESNSYTSTDLTAFAPHIAEEHGGIVRGTEMRKPDRRLVFVMGDGTLALMTYNSFHNVNAWHRYETQGKVISACALPDGQHADKLFLVVEREGERWLEVIDSASAFVDGQGADYVSTMETTAFADPQGNDRRVLLSVFEMYLAGDCPKEGVEVLAGKKEYSRFSGDATLKKGWVSMTGKADWTKEPVLGIRVRGNRPLHVLAVQA